MGWHVPRRHPRGPIQWAGQVSRQCGFSPPHPLVWVEHTSGRTASPDTPHISSASLPAAPWGRTLLLLWSTFLCPSGSRVFPAPAHRERSAPSYLPGGSQVCPAVPGARRVTTQYVLTHPLPLGPGPSTLMEGLVGSLGIIPSAPLPV